jgi:hypothetical protein
MSQQKRRPRVEATSINELLTKPFLNEAEVSAITGRALATLRNDRFLRRGIKYLKISGRSIRYKTQDVLAFMTARPINFDENQKGA